MAMPIAFVLGNGKSRLQFKEITRLQHVGFVVGCNAIHRDYPPPLSFPDVIVAVDDGMISELKTTHIPVHKLWFPQPQHLNEPAQCNPHRPRTNAGVHAIREVFWRMPYIHTVVALGFDFMIADAEQSVSNVYDGTANYGEDTRAHVRDNANRARFLSYVMDNEAPPGCNLYLAYPEKQTLIPASSPRIKSITFETLERNMIQ